MGKGNVIHHDPTVDNTIGQSGIHTLVDDIMDVFITSSDIEGLIDDATANKVYKNLTKFFTDGVFEK
jgi:hypothetical protein